MITIARAVNALKFGIAAANGTPKTATPENDRQRFNAVQYLGGLMHEMREFRDRYQDEWSGLTVFREVFSILDDESLDKETLKILRNTRNRAAFHLDPNVATSTLPKLPIEPFSFTAGVGRMRMASNNELADIVTFAFIYGHSDDMERMYERFSRYFDKLRALAVRFVENADRVLVSRAIQRGFRFEALPEGTYASETVSPEGDPPSF